MTVQSPYFQPGSNPSAVVQNVSANQNPDTTQVNFAAGRQGDLLVSEAHGPRYAAAARGSFYIASPNTTTGNAILAPGGTTSGVVIGNPSGSGILAEVHRLRVVPIGATVVVAALGLEYGVNPVSTTYQTSVVSMPLGFSATPKVKIWDAVTIVANTWLRALPLFFPATTDVDNVGYEFDLSGLVIYPGYAVNLVSTTTQGSIKFLVDYEWSEWPQ
jgi:hypothetical protein